ncbi:MAG: DUF4270 domain-containing protein [Chitinophagaceae bacterium]|nr:DUF4270 domain-containing protein [Chitinophagaceae bacterium]
MKNRYFFLNLIAIVTTVAIVFSACRRINEATELGGGLIPPVDGINTFDTLINVQTFNDTFGLATDSQYLDKNQEFFLGRINNDPFFGKTDARMFFELKPLVYPYSFGNAHPDSLFIDSVVLVMDYIETYGDTNTVQTVNVYEMDNIPANNFKVDSNYLIRKEHFSYSALLGSKTFAPKSLKDSVKVFRDTSRNQLRIRLDNSFGTRLLSYDSSKTSLNGAYANDSAFKSKLKGFAVRSMSSGNAVMGFNLNGVNTKLAIYYRYDKRVVPTTPKLDTTVAYFSFFSSLCAAANYIQRDYSGTPVEASVGGAISDQIAYIQTTPGTFTTIKIPDLATVNNRLIHRAELIIEQLYDLSDSTFSVPDLLYLDAFDPSITANYKYRTIPYDLSINSAGSFNLGSFGSFPTMSVDGAGNKIRVWKFNLSRYVQHILTGTQSIYDFRLLAPFSFIEQFGIPPGADITIPISINTSVAKGRVRVGGGNHPTQRMRLRLIYSKL